MVKAYYLFPDIYRDLLAFTSDDDIWVMNLEDKKSIRLTNGLGVATRPKFSPDGKYIAFTLVQLKDGNSLSEVYVIPTNGGEARRITYFGRPTTRAAGWTKDGKVLVITDYHTPFSSWTEVYQVDPNNPIPEKLPFGIVSNIAIGDNGIIVIARGYQDLPFWKNYKGGTKGEFWISYDNGKTFKKFLSLETSVSWPMIIRDRVYFISEHEGVANIYSVNLDGKDLKRHTNFTDYYVRNASSDGNNIVFQAGGDIYLLSPSDNKVTKIDIDLPTSRAKLQPFFPDVKASSLSEYSTNGEMISAIARGRLFLFRPWDGPVLQLGERNGVRYKFTNVLPSGDVIAVSDEKGEDRVVIFKLDGSKQLIDKSFGRIERIEVSPDGKKVLISNNRLELWLLDLETLNSKLIDKSDYGIISGLTWHSGSYWFAYSFPETPGTWSIRLANIDGNVIKVTSGNSIDFSPSFDPDGKYLYFLSRRRLDPVYDQVLLNLSFIKNVKPYLVVLSKSYSPFNKPLEKDEPKNQVDIDGIQYRVIPFPIDEDNYVRIAGIKGGKVLLFSMPIESMLRPWWSRGEPTGKLETYDVESKSKDLFLDKVNNFTVSTDGSKILIRQGEVLRLLDVSTKPDQSVSLNPDRKTGVVDLSRVKVLVDPKQDFVQMFNETWRLMKENYWKEDMNGIDWEGIYKKYFPLLERISTRFELSDLLKEMIGETKTSHSYEIPVDYGTQTPYLIGGLGADFKFNGECYEITRIYEGDPANENERSPLRDPGVYLEEGDCILSIDGVRLSRNVIPQQLLINKQNDQVILEVKTKKGEIKRVTVRLLRDEKFLAYRDWVEKNRKYVHERTNGMVGYIHVPDMGPSGFSEFYRSFISEFYKDGLIIDVRFNTGGHISGVLMQRLLIKRVGFIKPRNGKEVPFPEYSVPKVVVGLTNENAGSDGDLFSYMFKLFKLGPLIGKRTWGGVVGISGRHSLIDGTRVAQPEFAVHMYDIGLGIENHGVEPDIEVEISPQDYAMGKDPQLDKAIELALKGLKSGPV
ncbi:MAG: PDZ domain-containing protein [Sulfolobaceae archaeon]|nr:PDZ domain-containing protein [Sulfolobaceae archaeon]